MPTLMATTYKTSMTASRCQLKKKNAADTIAHGRGLAHADKLACGHDVSRCVFSLGCRCLWVDLCFAGACRGRCGND
jgi:hypothetical protein